MSIHVVRVFVCLCAGFEQHSNTYPKLYYLEVATATATTTPPLPPLLPSAATNNITINLSDPYRATILTPLDDDVR